MSNAVDPISVDGLRQLQAALKDLDGESHKRLRLVLNQAADLVVAAARPRAPKRTGALQASIKVASTATAARVKEGSAKVPYAGFIDYGGSVGRGRHGPHTGSAKRPFVKGGRILYPGYAEVKPKIAGLLQAGLDDLITEKGLR